MRLASAPEAPLRIEKALVDGRYELLSHLASGGMGEVWRARHVVLERVVAITLLREADEQAAGRLLLEARALARVRHPAVVQVFDCGADAFGVVAWAPS